MSKRLLTSAVVALGLASSAYAVDHHVPSAYPTIQAAIDAAGPGDTVIVADGVYRGDGNRDVSFAGKAITVRSAGGPATCVIDCDGSQTVPRRGFWFTNGETNASVLEGFTICNGSTPPGAIADVFNGAAILCANGSSPTIRGCVVRDNWAGCWGGALCASSQSHPIIDGCVFTGNYANDDGGAIFAWDGSHPIIINTLIVNNGALITGGGISNFSGAMTVRNTTIVGNEAPFGGGIYGWNVTMSNSIVHGNLGGNEIEGNPIVTYSNVEGGYDGEGNLDADPGFVDAANGDYHLAPGSPLIDAGDPSFIPSHAETDFDGDPRLLGLSVDIGADEYVRPGDVNRDGVVNFTDLLETLAAWGPCSGCAADSNGDGVVDFNDLLTLLANWGEARWEPKAPTKSQIPNPNCAIPKSRSQIQIPNPH